MDPRVKDLRLMRWKEIIIACNTSGMTKKAWLEANHINSKTFYRKQKEIRESELNRMELAKLDDNKASMPGPLVDVTTLLKSNEKNQIISSKPGNTTAEALQPEMMLQVGQYSIYIGSRVTEVTLGTVLRVIGVV